jgi:DNA (cytosine-5)-methyltransferase 1
MAGIDKYINTTIRADCNILNLYAGIGGNRKLWGDNHKITAIEIDSNIAKAYQRLYPNDTVVIGDAHEYLLNHYAEFDFIWSSPPCPSHSRARFGFGVCGHGYKYIYPDMTLYQEVILLKHIFKGLFCVENVIPYYNYLINPSVVIGRHAYWSNFFIPFKKISTNNMIAGNTKPPHKLSSFYVTGERPYLEELYGLNLGECAGFDKRKVLRNAVDPEIGKYILDAAMNVPVKEARKGQKALFELTEKGKT